MIKKGSWIEVEESVYYSGNLPVKIFVRGNCLSNCELGEETEIKTTTGHIVKGSVSKNKPFYNKICNLGKDAKEILMIKKIDD